MIKVLFYKIKYFLQKLFRKDHISDDQTLNLRYEIASFVYPRLLKFKKDERTGYPGYFCEYNEKEWKNKDEYLEAAKNDKIDNEVAAGTVTGKEKWEQVLDKMLFAFEWLTQIDTHWPRDDKKANDFYSKYNLKNPYAEIEENKYINYKYEMSPTYIKQQEEENPDLKLFGGLHNMMLSGEPDHHIKEPDKYKLIETSEHYYDVQYEVNIIGKKVQEGLDLFAKHFQNLWD